MIAVEIFGLIPGKDSWRFISEQLFSKRLTRVPIKCSFVQLLNSNEFFTIYTKEMLWRLM